MKNNTRIIYLDDQEVNGIKKGIMESEYQTRSVGYGSSCASVASTYTHTNTHTHTHTYIHTYIHIHVYKYTATATATREWLKTTMGK